MKASHITVCDSKYAAQALTLQRSLKTTSDHPLSVYSVDDSMAGYLRPLGLPSMRVFLPSDYIPANVEQLRKTRSPGAFAFTVKSLALLHAMSVEPALDWVSYFDVDICVFSDPDVILGSLPSHKPACFTPHRFAPSFRYYEPTVGRYNAGYVSFRNTQDGRHVLEHWRDLCLEWCQDFTERTRYGDQKYLNNLADQYPAVETCPHKGANAAPWNIADAEIRMYGDQVLIDGEPLLFYHFQGLKVYGPHAFDLYTSPELIVEGDLLDCIYAPYVRSLRDAYHELSSETAWRPAYTPRSWKNRLRVLIQGMLGTKRNLYHV